MSISLPIIKVIHFFIISLTFTLQTEELADRAADAPTDSGSYFGNALMHPEDTNLDSFVGRFIFVVTGWE